MSRRLSHGITEDRGPPIDRPPPARGARAERGATRPDAGSHEERIPRRHADARLLLPCLEILDVDRRSRFEIGHALQPWNVNEDAARDDAVLDVVDRILLMTLLDHRVCVRRVAVVEDALLVDVGERIEMRGQCRGS